jgi:hypothetical protein
VLNPSKKRKLSPSTVAGMTMARRSGRTPATRTVATPALEGFLDGPGREGMCGGFKRTRRWRVTNGTKGVIIQKVTRTFTVERFDGTSRTWAAITGGAIDTYVTDPDSSVDATDAQYWELWRVREDGTVISNEDSFSLCSLIPTATTIANTTKGNFVVSGEAYFYPTATVTSDDLGFATGTVAAAGVLPSRASDPAGDLASNGLVASGAAVTYTVTSTWDSTTTGTVAPPGALSVIT